MLPLTFREYSENVPADRVQSAWGTYLIYGGIPIVAQMQTETEKTTYLKNLCSETYLKDIVNRNGIRKTQELSDTFDMFASMIGSPVNMLKLANTFHSMHHKEINAGTLAKFEELMENAYLISKAKKYSIKGKKYIDQPFKLYFEDTGVRNARLNFRQQEPTRLMENIIYNELRSRGYSVDVGVVESRTMVGGKQEYRQLEIDFVVNRADSRWYIQSAYGIPDSDKMEQETRPFRKVPDTFRRILVVGDDVRPWTDDNGILIVGIRDFLLDETIMSVL